jgi:hypothetical protein
MQADSVAIEPVRANISEQVEESTTGRGFRESSGFGPPESGGVVPVARD